MARNRWCSLALALVAMPWLCYGQVPTGGLNVCLRWRIRHGRACVPENGGFLHEPGSFRTGVSRNQAVCFEDPGYGLQPPSCSTTCSAAAIA
jgi:hypothetical protein